MGGTPAEVEQACADLDGKACAAAKQRLLERGPCDLYHDQLAARCEAERESELSLARATDTQSYEPSRAFCQPAGR